MSIGRLVASLTIVVAFGACSTRTPAPSTGSTSAPEATGPRPIVVQGAMAVEVRTLVAALEQPVEEHAQGWTFWRGTIDGYPVVVSKTLVSAERVTARRTAGSAGFLPVVLGLAHGGVT